MKLKLLFTKLIGYQIFAFTTKHSIKLIYTESSEDRFIFLFTKVLITGDKILIVKKL